MVELKSRPALLVVDMLNAFVHPNGSFGKVGMPVSNHLAVVPAIQQLIARFDKQKLPVFFTRLAWKSDYSNCGRLLDKLPVFKDMNAFVEGSWDADVIDELKPSPQHIIIDKTRNSAFWKTDLEDQLRAMAVDQVVVIGVGKVKQVKAHIHEAEACRTNVCVESTVRDAFTNDFYTLVVSDATATLTAGAHKSSLENMQWFGDSGTVEEILEALVGS